MRKTKVERSTHENRSQAPRMSTIRPRRGANRGRGSKDPELAGSTAQDQIGLSPDHGVVAFETPAQQSGMNQEETVWESQQPHPHETRRPSATYTAGSVSEKTLSQQPLTLPKAADEIIRGSP